MSCGKGRGLVWIKTAAIIGIGSDGFRIFGGWTDHHFVKDQQWVDLSFQRAPFCKTLDQLILKHF